MDKRKTTIVLPNRLMAQIDATAEQLGIPKSSLMSMGAAMFLVSTAPLKQTPRKRRSAIAAIGREFQNLVQEALEKA